MAHDDDTLTLPDGPPARRQVARHLLRRIHPPGAAIPLESGESRIGRALDANIHVADHAMSRLHAMLNLAGSTLTITDLDSHNGVWVDGMRVRSRRLEEGSVLHLGSTFFLYRVEPMERIDANIPELLGESLPMRHHRAEVAVVAPSRSTVILLGETGTGKTHTAQAIHRLSGRRGNLVHVNCAAIADNIAETELFGHRAGAFTDARTDRAGLIVASSRGTLFLDEVALLSPQNQARLLLALESGQVTPVGGTTPVSVDLRVIVATNAPLAALVRAGTFRADLYARLADIVLTLPPLRERKEDILPLFRAAWGASVPAMTPKFVSALLNWRWPGNVREVEKLVTELKLRADGLPELDQALLGSRFSEEATPTPLPAQASDPGLDHPLAQPELEALLRTTQGNVSELARRVGRSTKQVYRWCARYGIDPASFRG